MQKYSNYKPTNIEWLGDVPSHWKVDTLKNHCEIFASNVDKKTEAGEIEVTLCNYVDVYKNLQINSSIEFMKATATQAEIEKFTLQLNDIILTKDSEAPDDIAVPSIVKKVFENFLCGYHLSIIRCERKIEPDFLIWVLRDLNIATQFHREAVGITRFGLAAKHFKNGIISFPPKTEQISIAAYLNQATENIDKVIATKQKQLEKLGQYKKSKIHECVTKGPDANVKLKASGIEWIGDVPEHWRVARLKDYIEFNPSSKPEELKLEDVVTVLPMETISEYGEILREDLLPFEEVDKGLSVFKNGDVIFAKITPCMENGKGAFINSLKTKVAFGSTEFFVLRPTSKADGKFIYYITRNDEYRKLAVLSMRGAAGQQRVPSEFLKFSRFGFPKREEQKRIANYLDNFCSYISKVKDNIEQQIEKLKLYRKCLIHECVTGKRKVTE